MDSSVFIGKIVGSFITALAFTGFIQYGQLFFGQVVSYGIVLITFLTAWVGYVYLRLSKLWWIRIAVVVLFVLWVLLLYLYISFSVLRWVVLMLNGGIVAGYPLFLRRHIFAKPLSIAAAWVLWLYFFTLDFDVYFYLQQFVFIGLLTIPFDIYGIQSDTMLTIPKKWGVSKSIVGMRVCLLVYVLLALFLPLPYLLTSVVIFFVFNAAFSYSKSFQVLWVSIFYDGGIGLQYVIALLLR